MKSSNERPYQTLQSLFLLFFIFYASLISLQAQETDYKKNAIHINYGTTIFVSQASGSYERLMLQEGNKRIKIKLDYSLYISNNLDYDTDSKVYEGYKGLSGVILYGVLEASLGLAFTDYRLASGFNPDPLKDYNKKLNGREFYGSIGFRYDKDSLILRAGIGNLDLLYVGAGFSF